MGRKATYPDWVTKHLEPGVYVNKVGDKYYLYRAHSEKKPGSDHPVRVFDGYIGRVTEDKGIIKGQKNLKIIEALDYALPFAVVSCSKMIHKGLCSTNKRNGTAIYVCSILQFLYGEYSPDLYRSSWLSIQYPGIEDKSFFTKSLEAGVVRGEKMIADVVGKTYGEDWHVLCVFLSRVTLSRIDGELYCPILSDRVRSLCAKHHLQLPI